jgi:hypothetical protein
MARASHDQGAAIREGGSMPHYWIRVSTDTPDPLTGHKENYTGFEGTFKQLVEDCGGTAPDVFFDVDSKAAYALIEDSDGNLDLDLLDSKLSDPKTLRVDLQTAHEKQNASP